MGTSTEFDGSIATIWETIAQEIPSAPAQIQGDRSFTWEQFERRANGVARTLLDSQASKDDRVAAYLRNCPEYMEVQHAAFKLGIPAVNTNYRYRDEELNYLWDDADVTAVVFHGSFTETVEGLRKLNTRIRQWIHVDDATAPCPPWAVPYEQATAGSDAVVRGPWGQGGEDLCLLYTGGTTGMPKGVMWRQADLLLQINDVAEVGYDLDNVFASIHDTIGGPGPVHISCSPYMHGSGWFGATIAMHQGGAVISQASHNLDPIELLDAIDRHGIGSITIAGEVFARRILAALEAEPDRWSGSTVHHVLTSGGMLGEASKRDLLEHWTEAAILDGFSSSEGFGMGWSIATPGNIPMTGRFSPGPNVSILDDDGQPVIAGSGAVGRLVVTGRLPLGYYKDPEKTERTFPLVNGVRSALPGDHAVLNEDGTIQLMGRDSLCINSGGEKIFTEEVEGVILDHVGVKDVLVVGVPDPEWGQAVAALVAPEPGTTLVDADVKEYVKSRIAGYKAPRHVVFVENVPRGPNGKADYPTARALIEAPR